MTHDERPRPTSIGELTDLVGLDLGLSSWQTVTQDRITDFAELTGDRQWIHVDPVRATPVFGSTVAHGLYCLSLGPALLGELLDLGGFSHALNYGYDRVRFPAPVPVGSRVRVSATIDRVDPAGPGAANMIATMTYLREGGDKPVCVAVMVGRLTE